MKSKIIKYLRSMSQEPFVLSNLESVEEGKVIQFPHSLQVMLQAIERRDGAWWGLIQDYSGKKEWALIKDPSWNHILNDRKQLGFNPVPISILKLERIKPSKVGSDLSQRKRRGSLIIHVGIYDNKWLINASSFGDYLRCPRIIFLKHQGLYQPRSVAAVKGNLIHEFHVSLYQQLDEVHQSNPDQLYKVAKQIKQSVIKRSWRDLASVNLTAEDGRGFIDVELFVNRMLEAPDFIPWSSDYVLSEFWLSSPTFGMQGFVDRLSLLENGEIAVFELKSGRQPHLKVKAAKHQAAAYALMLLSLGLKVRSLIIEFPEARPPYEERFIIEELIPHYFDRIPLIRNYIYHLTTSRKYKWPVIPWKTCTMACFIKRACQFYCYADNFAIGAIKDRCNPTTCQFQDPKRSGDYFCMFPSIFATYPVALELITAYVNWFRKLLLEEKRLVQEEINQVILPARERERSGNALSDMEFTGVQESPSLVLIFQKSHQSSLESDESSINGESNQVPVLIPLTRMQPGDPVLITPMGKLPRSPYSFRGHLLYMTPTAMFIEVEPEELRNDFIDWDATAKKFISTSRFRIDLLPSVTTIRAQLRAMDVIVRAAFDKTLQFLFPHALKLRNLVTFVQEPQFKQLSDDVISSVKSLPLNNRQKKAILQTLRAKDFVLIHGPPGSGKTTTICHLMALILKHQKQKQLNQEVRKLPILVAGFTRKSVDNIVLKWQKEFSSIGKIVRVGMPSSGSESEVNAASLEYFVDKLLDEVNEEVIDVPKTVITELESADIIATTAASALSSILEKFQFQTVIVDEAGQCTEPLTLIPLLKGERFVLVGDHIQLPPVVMNKNTASLPPNVAEHLKIYAPIHDDNEPLVDSRVINDISKNNNEIRYDTLELSLFSRLFRKYGTNDEVTIFLNEQYRMHPLIADFASTFYLEPIQSPHMENQTLDNWLKELFGEKVAHAVSLSLSDTLWNPKKPFIGVDTFQRKWYQDLNGQSESSFNDHEAEFIASLIISLFKEICFSLREHGETISTIPSQLDNMIQLLVELGSAIGVTTPYRTQVMKIKIRVQEYLQEFLREQLNYTVTERELKSIEQSIMIETVDRFQGREKEIMIISLVDSNPSGKVSELLQDDRRLNVAITRAKRKLIVVGNLTMLSSLPFYHRLLEYLRRNNSLITL